MVVGNYIFIPETPFQYCFPANANHRQARSVRRWELGRKQDVSVLVGCLYELVWMFQEPYLCMQVLFLLFFQG